MPSRSLHSVRFSPQAVVGRVAAGLVVAAAIMALGASSASAALSTPSMQGNSSTNTTVGLQVFDHVNLSGGSSPTGTLTFSLFAPGDTACATPIFTSTVPVSGTGSDNSTSYGTTGAGTYQWIAAYSGDASNDPAATACGEPTQSVIVSPHHVAAALTTSQAAGGAIHATLALTGGYSPTGTATFTITGPNDTFCQGAPVAAQTITINGAGTYDSPPFRPATPGTYTYRLRYDGDTNNYGAGPTSCVDQNASITTDETPTAAYTPSTYTPGLGQTITFDATPSTDPDGAVATYRWIWGDGTPDGTGATPTHAYTTPGQYSAGLYITDTDGQTTAVGHAINVGDQLPTARYRPTTYTPATGQPVSFDAAPSNAPAGTITTYHWTWGDGTADTTGPTPTHTFTTPGRHRVALYITDNTGQTAAVGHGITVAPTT